MSSSSIAIIGAGISGLSLALLLQQRNIHCTIYELRQPDVMAAGALMISPNGLRSLDVIGVYDRLKSKGYHFSSGSFRKNNHELIDSYELGSKEKYGYDCLRVYRQVLLDELRQMVKEAGVGIVAGKKFSHVVEEDEEGVTFAFADGEQCRAGLLIGSDGIWSSVRKYIAPEAKPEFAGVMTVVGAIPTAKVKFPYEGYDALVSIHGEAGAFLLAPQNADGSEMIVAMQYQTPERDKAGWDALNQDKQRLLHMLREGYQSWNETVRSAIDAIDPETLFIWPFYVVPRLERWISEKDKVILVGDAAHAIPPAAGQGANQAFEDVHSLSLLMAAAKEQKVPMRDCIEWWQQYRRHRTDKATALTVEMTKRRLPGWSGEGGTIDNGWLYNVRLAQDVERWLSSRRRDLV